MELMNSAKAEEEQQKAIFSRAERESEKTSRVEQDLIRDMNVAPGRHLGVPQQEDIQSIEEPQEDSGVLFSQGGDDESDHDRMQVPSSKPMSKANVPSGDDEGDDSISESDDESEDDLGEMVEVIGFTWSTVQPKFLVRWSKGGKLRHPASVVLIDFPNEALKVLWKGYRNKLQVMDWVNGLDCMKSVVDGWKDIESYAANLQWDGSFVVSNVAAQKKRTRPVKAKKRNAFGDLMDECVVGTPTLKETPTLTEAPGTASTTTPTLKEAPATLGKETPPTTYHDTVPTLVTPPVLDATTPTIPTIPAEKQGE